MDQSRPTIWLEDLEGHREPALYYLTSEDEPAGPHLICDWNGSPTNYDEFNIDLICKMIECSPMDIHNSNNDKESRNVITGEFLKTIDMTEQSEDVMINDNNSIRLQNLVDADHPYHTILPETSQSPNNLLVENDGSRLEFLTVPPLVASLLKRQLQLQARIMAKKDRPFTIAEEDSESEGTSSINRIEKNKL